MYKIIGADGKEYGPIPAEQLRQWLREGRVNSQTKVQPENGADWQPLSALPEFAADLGPPPGSPPPVPSPNAPGKTSGMAIASLVLGVLGVISCGITAVVGLILGIVSLVKIRKSGGQMRGEGLAIAGTVVSGVMLLMIPIGAAMMLPALAKAKGRAQTINCVNNVKQLNLALIMYANGNSDKFPSAADWGDAIQSNLGSAQVFLCPGGDASKRSHYAFNARLDGVEINDIKNPATTVLIFETDGGWNLSGGAELIPKPSRHGRLFVVGFADGHVEQASEARLEQLNWDP